MSDPVPSPRPSSETTAAIPWDQQLAEILARQEHDWAHGMHTSVDDLARGFQGACERGELLLELIHNEIVLREQAGESPTIEDYQRRFPELAETLRLQWEMDQLIAGDDSWAALADSSYVALRGEKLANRYELQEEIGRGAIGIVYRAWDSQLKRVVAIKRLRAGVDAPQSEVARFRQEAEAIARVRHPNIVQIYDIAELEGLPCLTMEYCAGGSLAEQIQGAPLRPRLAAQLVLQISDGIAAAHACEIIHRDLKPANVLLQGPIVDRVTSESTFRDAPRSTSFSESSSTRRGDTESPAALPVLKISDFGLAKLLSSDAGATATGSVLGTPAYMAPEQAWGDARRVGPAVDVYAVGAILYECLTGRPPFRGSSISETLVQVRDQDPIGVRQLEPGVPTDLETITHKCLRKDASQRYPSAAAMADDLSRFLRYQPIMARRERWHEVAVRTFRRYPAVSSLAIASILLLVLIAVGSLMFAQRLRFAKLTSEQSERAARLGQAEALVGRAHGIRLSRRPGQRFEALAALRHAVDIGRELQQPPEWFDPLRDEAIAALALPDAYVEEYRTEAEPVTAGDISDDGRRYVLAFGSGDLVLRNSADHRELARLPRLDNGVLAHFIGNHAMLVTGQPGLAYELWDFSGSEPRRGWSHDEGCEQFNVSQNGKLLAVADRNDLTIVDVANGAVLATQPIAPYSREPQISLHPTHPYVLLHSYFCDEIQIRNWHTADVAVQLRPGKKHDYPGYTGADWSPDGKRLIVINAHGEATYWYDFDAESARATLTRTDRPSKEAGGGGPEVRFNVRGDRLLMMGWSTRLTICDALRGDTIFTAQALSPLTKLGDKKLDPNGRFAGLFRLPDQPQRVGCMSLAEGHEFHVLNSAMDTAAHHANFDPTGTVVAICTENGLFMIDVESGQTLVRTAWKQFEGYHICFDATGCLYVSGQAACLRWPCRVIPGDRMILELEIPERIHVPSGNVYLATNNDGSVLTAGAWNGFGMQEYAGCWLKTAGEPAARKVVGQQSGSLCAVSPDGHQMVLCSDTGSRLVSDRAPTVAIKTLPASTVVPRYSQDGKFLVAGNARIDVNSWEQSVIEDGAGTSYDLTADGKQILTYTSAGILGLIDAASGRVLARLEGPEPCESPRFSPRGNLVLCRQQGKYQVFDLPRIRTELAKLGLDWNAPQLPPVERQRSPWKLVVPRALKEIATADELLEFIDGRAVQKAECDPHDGFAAFSAAMVAIGDYDLVRAVDLLDRSCEALPEAITPRQWRAYAQAERRDFSAAVEDASWVLQRIEEDDFRLLRAEWLFHLGQFEPTIEDCSRVISANENLARFAYGLRGQCQMKLGIVQQAAVDHGKFLELTRDDPRSLDMAARPMVGKDISLRHPAIAMLLVDKIRSLNAGYDRAAANTIGLVLYRNHRFQDVIDWFEHDVDTPNEGLAPADLYVLAMANQQLGASQRARDCLARANARTSGSTPEFDSSASISALRAEAEVCVWGVHH